MTVLNNLIISITITHLTLSLQIPPEFKETFTNIQVDSKPDDHGEFGVEEFIIYSRDVDPKHCTFRRTGNTVSFNCMIDTPIKVTAQNKDNDQERDTLIDVAAQTYYTINMDASAWGNSDREFIEENGGVKIKDVLEIYMEPYETFLTNMAGMQVKIESTVPDCDFYVILELPYVVDNSRIRDRIMIL